MLGLVYNGGMKRETIGGSGCDRWDHEHEVRGRSLILGIRYHGHGCRGNMVESMNVIGHGKASPWGGLVKFFQRGAAQRWRQYESKRIS